MLQAPCLGACFISQPKAHVQQYKAGQPEKREESLSTVWQVARVRVQCALNHISYPKPRAQSQQDAATWPVTMRGHTGQSWGMRTRTWW